MTTIHRISYQRDDLVVTTCSLVLPLTRDEVRAAPFLTFWRGSQTCDNCPNEVDELPLIIRELIRGTPVECLPMLPKQVDSLYDLLESYGCEDITLKRRGTTRVGGHVHPLYVLSLVHYGLDREWSDHSLTRLFGTAVVEVTNSRVPEDDRPQHLS